MEIFSNIFWVCLHFKTGRRYFVAMTESVVVGYDVDSGVVDKLNFHVLLFIHQCFPVKATSMQFHSVCNYFTC